MFKRRPVPTEMHVNLNRHDRLGEGGGEGAYLFWVVPSISSSILSSKSFCSLLSSSSSKPSLAAARG